MKKLEDGYYRTNTGFSTDYTIEIRNNRYRYLQPVGSRQTRFNKISISDAKSLRLYWHKLSDKEVFLMLL